MQLACGRRTRTGFGACAPLVACCPTTATGSVVRCTKYVLTLPRPTKDMTALL